jgi:hypothetical protein
VDHVTGGTAMWLPQLKPRLPYLRLPLSVFLLLALAVLILAESHNYRVVLFGSPEMTGQSGLPDVKSFARSYNFEAGLTNSEVMIYVGHGAGAGAGTNQQPFKQQGLYIDSAYYKADGNHLIIEGRQSEFVLPKPEVTAKVLVNFPAMPVVKPASISISPAMDR